MSTRRPDSSTANVPRSCTRADSIITSALPIWRKWTEGGVRRGASHAEVESDANVEKSPPKLRMRSSRPTPGPYRPPIIPEVAENSRRYPQLENTGAGSTSWGNRSSPAARTRPTASAWTVAASMCPVEGRVSCRRAQLDQRGYRGPERPASGTVIGQVGAEDPPGVPVRGFPIGSGNFLPRVRRIDESAGSASARTVRRPARS